MALAAKTSSWSLYLSIPQNASLFLDVTAERKKPETSRRIRWHRTLKNSLTILIGEPYATRPRLGTTPGCWLGWDRADQAQEQ